MATIEHADVDAEHIAILRAECKGAAVKIISMAENELGDLKLCVRVGANKMRTWTVPSGSWSVQ